MDPLDAWSVKLDFTYLCSNPKTDHVIEFRGPFTKLNSVPFNKSFTVNPGPWTGWKFIGNPYPCSIDPNNIVWDPNLYPAIYFWDGILNIYHAWVSGIGPMIPPTQGFFVEAGDDFTFSLFLVLSEYMTLLRFWTKSQIDSF